MSLDIKEIVQNIAPGLWRFCSGLTGRHQSANGYILKRGNGWVLIDPPGDLGPGVLELCGEGTVVEAILVTHLQEEHVAGAGNFPGVPVHVPHGDEYLCHGWEAYRNVLKPWPEPWDWENRGCFRGHLAGALNERPAPFALTMGTPLRTGSRLGEFQILATPGHGKNAVTLVVELEGRNVGFCGDLVYGEGLLWNWYDCEWDYGRENGARTLADSADRLAHQWEGDILCPAHGPVIDEPQEALFTLARRIRAVLSLPSATVFSVAEAPEPLPGWRQITPHLFQWKSGNTIVLVSRSGAALVVDDGVCIWEPLAERARQHDEVFHQLKKFLGIRRIEWIIPTHFHGDHTEFIPRLAKSENAGVACLDSVAGPMEFPDRYNLACPLPWYGSCHERLEITLRLPEGGHLHWEEYDLEFFRLGGQTGYHLGLDAMVDGRRTLFVGDAFLDVSGAAGPVICWNDAEPFEKGYVFALREMIERRPELLVAGHGFWLAGPMPCLERTLAAWLERMKDYARLNPRNSWDEFFSPYGE